MLKLVRQQRFGKKCETLAGMQRALFEEDVDADIAALTTQLDKLLPPPKKKRPAYVRCVNLYRTQYFNTCRRLPRSVLQHPPHVLTMFLIQRYDKLSGNNREGRPRDTA